MVKLFEDGLLRWQWCLGGNTTDSGSSIQQTADGGYVLLGETQSSDGDLSAGYDSFDVWVVRMDQNGHILWQNSLGGTGSGEDTTTRQTNDGKFLVLETIKLPGNDVAGLRNPSSGYLDTCVVKLNHTGGPLWQKCIGGSYNDEAVSIEVATDGGYLIALTSNSAEGVASWHHYESVFTSDALLV